MLFKNGHENEAAQVTTTTTAREQSAADNMTSAIWFAAKSVLQGAFSHGGERGEAACFKGNTIGSKLVD